MLSHCHRQRCRILNQCLENFRATCKRHLHEKEVRVRFAPSPTGYLHIGGLRTALYNFLFARQQNGKFIVRIEDTDQVRLMPLANQRLMRVLDWAGIHADESPVVGGQFGPYTQSERLHFYKKYAEQLVSEGKAYRCFCSQRRLDLLKQQQARNNEIKRYDNRCRDLPDSKVREYMFERRPYVIRLKLPQDEPIHCKDELFGESTQNISKQEGDPVLLKTDGFATYHLANVVDDHLMRISHVIRGKEWLNSLPKHIHLYQSFGWQPPLFYHVPLLMNMDGKKLSKRQGDVFVEDYVDGGYAPSALLNFVASCGGGFAPDTFPLKVGESLQLLGELSHRFNLDKLLLSGGKINFDKLDDFSFALTRHMLSGLDVSKSRREATVEVVSLIKTNFPDSYLFAELTQEQAHLHVENVLESLKDRLVKLQDVVSKDFAFLWCRPPALNMECSKDLKHFINSFIKFLSEENVEEEGFEERGRKLIKSYSGKGTPTWKTMRLMLAGVKQGVPVLEIIKMLGKNESLHRLGSAFDDMTVERTRV